MTRPALLVISLGLFLSTSVNLYSAAQDYIKENPSLTVSSEIHHLAIGMR